MTGDFTVTEFLVGDGDFLVRTAVLPLFLLRNSRGLTAGYSVYDGVISEFDLRCEF